MKLSKFIRSGQVYNTSYPMDPTNDVVVKKSAQTEGQTGSFDRHWPTTSEFASKPCNITAFQSINFNDLNVKIEEIHSETAKEPNKKHSEDITKFRNENHFNHVTGKWFANCWISQRNAIGRSISNQKQYWYFVSKAKQSCYVKTPPNTTRFRLIVFRVNISDWYGCWSYHFGSTFFSNPSAVARVQKNECNRRQYLGAQARITD